MNKEISKLKELLNELDTYSSLMEIRGGYPHRSIRTLLKIADEVYPLIDGFIEEHYPRHGYAKDDEIEFNIKVHNYFYNVGRLCEEVGFDDVDDQLNDLIWDHLAYELEDFMKCYAPDIEYYVEGRGGGWLVVKHTFTMLWREKRYVPWDSLSRRDKLEFLSNYVSSVIDFIDDVKTLIFWMEFEEKLEEAKKSICSEETAKDVIEFIKNKKEEVKTI